MLYLRTQFHLHSPNNVLGKFNVLLTVHRDISVNKNQQDALFTFNLFQ